MFAPLRNFVLHAARVAQLALSFSGVTLLAGLAPHPAFASHGTGLTLRPLSGSSQQTTYASSFPKPLTVFVVDSVSRKSRAGIQVDFFPSAGVRLSDASAVTNQHGLASVIAYGTAVGTSSVKAEIGSDPSDAADFTNLIVTKAVLTVVPVDVQSIVGVIPPITEYTIQGFLNGDTEDSAQIEGVPVLSTIATENSPDANYAIKGGVGTLTSPKYAFKAGFGALVLRGADKPSRTSTPATAGTGLPQDGLPVVRSAIHSTNAPPRIVAYPGRVNKGNVLPSIESVHPGHTVNLAVRQAVTPGVATADGDKAKAVVRSGVFSQQAGTAMAGEFVQGVHSALPDVTQGPVSPKASRIRKAFNPPTPN